MKFIDFFKGEKGRLSSTKLSKVLVTVSIMGMWLTVSISKMELVIMDGNLVWLLCGCLGIDMIKGGFQRFIKIIKKD